MTPGKPLPSPPRHLSKPARAWWKSVVTDYQLEPHHVHLLTHAAEAWDRCAAARAVLDVEGVSYTDRFGCPRQRPEVAVERDSRLAFARLLRQLDLQGEPNPSYRRR